RTGSLQGGFTVFGEPALYLVQTRDEFVARLLVTPHGIGVDPTHESGPAPSTPRLRRCARCARLAVGKLSYFRMSASASSRCFSMSACVSPSTLSRNSGSVLEGRMFIHQSG